MPQFCYLDPIPLTLSYYWLRPLQDEYGTVAYKTVELDTFLDDAAVQHREVQAHESDKFLGYFQSLT